MSDGGEGERAVRPSGLRSAATISKRKLPSDVKWRAAATARIAELGVGQIELAAAVECAQSQISYLLAEEGHDVRRSFYVERISHALGIRLPAAARVELAVAGLAAAGDGEYLENLAATAEAFAARHRRGPQ